MAGTSPAMTKASTSGEGTNTVKRAFQAAQRRGEPPARRLLEVAQAVLQALEIRDRIRMSASGIGKKIDRALHIEPRPELLGEALGGVEGDIVQAVQFQDDHDLDHVVDADGTTWRRVVLRVVGLIDEVATEQDVEGPRPPQHVVSAIDGESFAHQRSLKAGARQAVEAEIEQQEMVLEHDLGDGGEMALGIRRADAEARLRLDAEHAGRQQVPRALEDVLLESLDVHFEEIAAGDHPFGKQAVEAAHRNFAHLRARLAAKSAFALLEHRARERIRRVEIEIALPIGGTERDVVKMPVGPAGIAFLQAGDDFRNGIETMQYQIVAQNVPAHVGAALHPDVNDHERLARQSLARDPSGECGPVVEAKIFHRNLRTTKRETARSNERYRNSNRTGPCSKWPGHSAQ